MFMVSREYRLGTMAANAKSNHGCHYRKFMYEFADLKLIHKAPPPLVHLAVLKEGRS